MTFLRYYLFTITNPVKTFEHLRDEPGRVRFGFQAVLIMAVL
jgi:hypothetical protein